MTLLFHIFEVHLGDKHKKAHITTHLVKRHQIKMEFILLQRQADREEISQHSFSPEMILFFPDVSL